MEILKTFTIRIHLKRIILSFRNDKTLIMTNTKYLYVDHGYIRLFAKHFALLVFLKYNFVSWILGTQNSQSEKIN